MKSDAQCQALPIQSQEPKQVIDHEKYWDFHGKAEVGDDSGGREWGRGLIHQETWAEVRNNTFPICSDRQWAELCRAWLTRLLSTPKPECSSGWNAHQDACHRDLLVFNLPVAVLVIFCHDRNSWRKQCTGGESLFWLLVLEGFSPLWQRRHGGTVLFLAAGECVSIVHIIADREAERG